jgi:hypothetical protein
MIKVPLQKEYNAKERLVFLAVFFVMMAMAFIQCYKTTHDLHWASEPDFDRDIAFIQGTLNGHYGQDPNVKGEHLWYSPLLFSIETLIVKATGMPIHDVVTQTGIYLNLLGPICFFILLYAFFGIRIALAGSLSFLFLATGNMLGGDTATYSPWLFPVNFVQFLFYISILLCYKAYSKQTYAWFILLGTVLGITFLGHAAPAIIMVLMLLILHGDLMLQAIRKKEYNALKKYLLQGVAVFIPFVLASLPLTYFVAGKYHLHMLNRDPSQYTDEILYISNWKWLLKEMLSVSFVIAVIGFTWFYKKFPRGIIRKIILSWLFITIVMYAYTTMTYILERQFQILLPVTVPSFHYFHYFNAAQSVFFGFGLVSLIQFLLRQRHQYINLAVISIVLLWTFIYYPFYKNRTDFIQLRADTIAKEKDKDKLDIYQYIIQYIPENDVILCDRDVSLYPVMPTARKMVSTAFTLSNPYIDFNKREAARLDLLSWLRKGDAEAFEKLADQYQVNYILLSNKDSVSPTVPLKTVFRNNAYTIESYKNLKHPAL